MAVTRPSACAPPPAPFRDRLAFVGLTEAGVGDRQATPFGSESAGVGVRANDADNLLSRRWIQDTGLLTAISVLALVLLLALEVGAVAGPLMAWPPLASCVFRRSRVASPGGCARRIDVGSQIC